MAPLLARCSWRTSHSTMGGLVGVWPPPSPRRWTVGPDEASRDLDHVWTFRVDGTEVGSWTETDLHTVRRVSIAGSRDTHAGGDLDDLRVEGCP